MTNICPVIFVSMMNIYDVLLTIFFHNNFLSCAFFKTYFQSKWFVSFFMYREQILVLYCLCINDKHFSHVFLFINDKYYNKKKRFNSTYYHLFWIWILYKWWNRLKFNIYAIFLPIKSMHLFFFKPTYAYLLINMNWWNVINVMFFILNLIIII